MLERQGVGRLHIAARSHIETDMRVLQPSPLDLAQNLLAQGHANDGGIAAEARDQGLGAGLDHLETQEFGIKPRRCIQLG